MSNRDTPVIIAKNIFSIKAKGGKEVLETREWWRQETEAPSVMIVSKPPNKKSEVKKNEAGPSTEAVSEANMKETAPMVLAR